MKHSRVHKSKIGVAGRKTSDNKMSEEIKLESFQLRRSGQRSLAFQGNVIASATTRVDSAIRWTASSVYETDKGKVVVGMRYMTCVTCVDGESDNFKAKIFESREDAVTYLEEEIPALASYMARQMGVLEVI